MLLRLISILLFGLEIFTSFHTYPCLHGRALGVSAPTWHLTNMRDGGRITTGVWNRSRSALTIVNSAGSKIARFICDTAVHHPIQSVFLIFHQSELLQTASDNLQQIPALGHQGPGFQLCHSFHFHNRWEKVTAGVICSAGRSIDCRIAMIRLVKVYLGLYTRSSMQLFLSLRPRHCYLHTAVVLNINQVRADIPTCLT